MIRRLALLVGLLSSGLVLASLPILQAQAANEGTAPTGPIAVSSRPASGALKGSSATPIFVNLSGLPTAASTKTARPAVAKLPSRVPNPAALARAKTSPAGTAGVRIGRQISSRVDLAFTGIDSFSEAATQGGVVEPPDTQIAVGNTQIVEMVNQTGQVYDKTFPHTPIGHNFALNAFFGMAAIDPLYVATDPRILYDHSVDRWYATMLGFNLTTNASTVFLAVSQTGDATGAWVVYRVYQDKSLLCDQPKLGYSDDKFVVACNDFDINGTYVGAVLIVASKSQALGGGAMATGFSDPNANSLVFGAVPAQNLGAGSTAYMIENQSPMPDATLWSVTGDPAAAAGVSGVSFAPVDVPMTATDTPGNATQQGSATLIDTADTRFMNAVVLNGELWTTANEACTPAGDTAVRNCLRILQIGVAGPSLDQSTTAGLNGKDIYYPTLGLTSIGDAVIVYNLSSFTDYPGVYATQQLAGQPGLFFGGGPIRAGTQPYTGIRWGDYGAAATDLYTPGSVWVGGEWSTATGSPVSWSTGIGRIANWTPPTVPGAPIAVNATAGNAQVALSWTAPSNDGDTAITGYQVTPYIGTTAQSHILTGSSDANYVLTGLTNGTAYTFTVAAINGVGNGPDSSPSNLVTPITVAGPPTGVVGTAGNGQIALTWTAPVSNGGSTITGYRVTPFIGTTAQTPILTGSAGTSYTVTGLMDGTAYTFTVAASNGAGTGTDSTHSMPATPFTFAGAPTSIAGIPGNGLVALTWSAPASNGGSPISGYRVTPFIGSTAQASILTGSAVTNYTVTGLRNGTAYTFTVAAVNGAGIGPDSTPSNPATPINVAGSPTGVAGTAGNGQVALTWSAPVSNGGSTITGYRVTPFIGTTAQVSIRTGSAVNSYTVTGLTNGTAYTFTVAAVNGAGPGPDSTPSNPATPFTIAAAPTGVAGSPGNGQVALTWIAPASNGGSAITDYRVTSFIGTTAQASILTGSVSTSYTVTGLTNGTAYTFRVATVNGAGVGFDSSASSPVVPVFGTNLGGVLTAGPAVTSWSSNRTDVFIRGADNALYHMSWNGSTWSLWENLGGGLGSAPGAVSWGPDRLDVFVRGTDGQLWHKGWYGTYWGPWAPLGGGLAGAPAVASWSAGRLDVFVQGTDGQLWHKGWYGTTWGPWAPLGGGLASAPAAVSWSANRIDVFVRASDNALWQRSWTGTMWSNWTSLGGTLTSAPAVSSCAPLHLDVYAAGGGSTIRQRGFNGTSWSTWNSVGAQSTADPAAVCRVGTQVVDLYFRGTDAALWRTTISAS